MENLGHLQIFLVNWKFKKIHKFLIWFPLDTEDAQTR